MVKGTLLYIQKNPAREFIYEYSSIFKNRGWKCVLLTSHESAPPETHSVLFLALIRLRKMFSHFVLSVRALGEVLRGRNEYAAVHIVNPCFFGLVFILAARIQKIKVVYDIRAATYGDKTILFKLALLPELLNCLLSNKILIVHRGLLHRMHLSKLAHKIVEIPNGVNVDKLNRIEPCLRSDLGISEQAKVFVYVGSLDKKRNLLTFVEAFVEAFREDSEVILVIIGSGDEYDDIKEFIEINNTENIYLLGRLPRDQAFAILKTCDYGIAYVPKVAYYENQPPLKTIQYLSCGLPVLATNTAGNLVYINENNGVVVNDDTNSIITGLKKLKNLKSRINVKEFDWSSLCETIEEVYFGDSRC